MKIWINCLAAIAILALVASTQAKDDAGAAAEDSVHGRVTMLRVHRENQDLLDLVVNTGTKQEPHEITFVVNGTMPITLDGHAAKASDLAAGQTVTVTPSSGKPTKIEAESHKRKPK